MDVNTWQWVILIGMNLILYWISPWSNKVNDFFKGSTNNKAPNAILLTSSLVICWLFAKSITNAADLGFEFGIVGGVAYSGYYFSFLVAGLVIYRMRIKGGFASIHQFLHSKYGRAAVAVFTILITFRLFNEIWSNSMVVGSYFGAWGTFGYYAALVVFTLLTLLYTIKGGMRTSIFTDLIQMVLFTLLLIIILGLIIPKSEGGFTKILTSGEWAMSQGLNLFFVALIQVLSYPFHDPIMTDRGFMADPKTTLRSFLWATVIGVFCIILFSFVGVYAAINGIGSPVALEVARVFGLPMMLMMNAIMMTSAASTIDSTLTSTAKLVHLDLLKGKNLTISSARWTMVIVTVLGTIPVFFGPAILSATTISGTMVLGLAPVFIFWNLDAPKISFYASILAGILFGLLFIFVKVPSFMLITTGKYADLLSVNLFGTISCFLLFLIPYWIKKYVAK